MKALLALIISLSFFANNSFGQSIVYDGFECELEPTEPFVPAQSRLEVTEDLGNGNYKLLMTGGVPILKNESNICIGSFGTEASEESDFQRVNKKHAEALAFFTGNILIVTFGTFITFGEPEIIDSEIFIYGPIAPQNQTLTFQFVPERQSFRLINYMLLDETVAFIGLASNPDGFTESMNILSTSIKNPVINIEYFLEP